MSRLQSYVFSFKEWRRNHISDNNFMILLSVVIGFFAGLGAVLVKYLVHLIKDVLLGKLDVSENSYYYIIYPLIGILLTVIFVRFILRQYVGDGVPSVLRAISKNRGVLKAHNMFSSLITSTLTVGFGGSVGLEGPTVITGAALGGNIGRLLNLNYKQTVQLLVFGCAAAMSAIFKAPIAAVVFVLEVIMFDFTMASLLPLLIASVTGVLTTYAFRGQEALFNFDIIHGFSLSEVHFYILLGVFAGFVSLYMTRVLLYFQRVYERDFKWYWKFLSAGLALGLLIYIFPSLYGEGFESTNSCLSGAYAQHFENSLFHNFQDSHMAVIIMIAAIIIFKVVATALTFGSGGIGGIFATTLFTGAHAGLLFALVLSFFNFETTVPTNNFAFVGMAGLIAGVIHAPLTAIFLIAEITGGYSLFVPLMITSIISYGTVKIFSQHSVYTNQLAKANELLTHNKDQSVLCMMSLQTLIETDFKTVNIEGKLRDLVDAVSASQRNIYPAVNSEGGFCGMVVLDDIRNLIFNQELYDTVSIKSLIIQPPYTLSEKESVEDVVQKFQRSEKYNLPVVEEGKYAGFISRARLFSEYRRILKESSES